MDLRQFKFCGPALRFALFCGNISNCNLSMQSCTLHWDGRLTTNHLGSWHSWFTKTARITGGGNKIADITPGHLTTHITAGNNKTASGHKTPCRWWHHCIYHCSWSQTEDLIGEDNKLWRVITSGCQWSQYSVSYNDCKLHLQMQS